MIPHPICFQYTCILFDLIVRGQGPNDINFVCETLSCSYTYIYIKLWLKLHSHIIIIIDHLTLQSNVKVKVTSFLLATLCHVFIHLHTKYEGTGLKTKIFCCRQSWMIKNKSCDLEVKSQGHSDLIFIWYTPSCHNTNKYIIWRNSASRQNSTAQNKIVSTDGTLKPI